LPGLAELPPEHHWQFWGQSVVRHARAQLSREGFYLEALAAIDTVFLDKTGTLTFGAPQIRDVNSSDGFAVQEIIAAASIAERRSEHPLAKVIVARAAELHVPVAEPDSFLYTPGRGIRVTYQGDEILVGSRAFLVDQGVENSLPIDGHSRGCV
jgi:cation transport ATPase